MNPSDSNNGLLLAIESSCDDMAVAVLDGRSVLSSVVASQSRHATFGGVVPEIASRAHLKLITRTVNAALEEAGTEQSRLSAIAVTKGPGLPGSLIVGNSFARSYADGLGIPLIGVNHLQGHIFSVFLEQEGPEFPFLSLVVSGGHTQLVVVDSPSDFTIIGQTRDDAAGEAFDKVGKLLGLGYPAGPLIDRHAQTGNPDFHRFPRTKLDGFDFSFSGIKTSVLYYLKDIDDHQREQFISDNLDDICASFQSAMIDMLTANFRGALKDRGLRNASIVGGVSANSELRSRASTICDELGVSLYYPPMKYCTDNAAMVGIAAEICGLERVDAAEPVTINPNLTLEGR